MEKIYDLGIIGGGPAGYSAAIRAAQKGFSVVLFEKDSMGGVCLNRGCIPTKTILHCSDFYKSLKKADKFGIEISDKKFDYEKIFNRKNDIVLKIQKSLTKLVQSFGIEIVCEEAKLIAQDKIEANENIYQCKNIILATGSKPANIKGLETDGQFILNSNDILNLKEIPENILIVGSGAIGVEWARIFNALDKNVTVVELAERLLPLADVDVSKRLDRLFKKNKIKFFTGTKVESINDKTVLLSNCPRKIRDKEHSAEQKLTKCQFLREEDVNEFLECHLEKVSSGGSKVRGDNCDTRLDGQEFTFDMVLCAIGREPVLPQIEGISIDLNGKFVKVDDNFRTNISNIFAVGDLVGKMLLAHSAVHQAVSVIDYITEQKQCHFDTNSVPSVIYGNPEIAWVGKTEEMLAGLEYKVSNFPVAALGKAMADDEIDGFVKVLSVDNKIVGAHIVSPEASALVQQFALMIDNELKTDDILKTVFAHPTYSEAVFESVLGLDSMSLSLPKGM